MLRRGLIVSWLAVASLSAAIWPEQLWDNRRSALKQISLPDQEVSAEYGLEGAEEAQYPGFLARGYRLKDPTSAMAVYQWLKPAGAKPSKIEKVAVQTATRAFLLKGNYVLDFDGRLPTEREIEVLFVQLARFDNSALPALPGYLPAAGRVPGTDRFVIGPASLARFFPAISPSVAAFSMGAEAQVARYESAAGPTDLAIFSYPSPQIARDRYSAFQGVSGAMAKRSGALVAVAVNAPNADEAEKLLARVNETVTVTWNEQLPGRGENPGVFLLNVFTFIGLLLGMVIAAGIGYAGVRIGWRRLVGRSSQEQEEMLTLHLGDK